MFDLIYVHMYRVWVCVSCACLWGDDARIRTRERRKIEHGKEKQERKKKEELRCSCKASDESDGRM